MYPQPKIAHALSRILALMRLALPNPIAEYMKHARQCMTLAAAAMDENVRAHLQMAARKWMLLAAERDESLNPCDLSEVTGQILRAHESHV